eukprot:g27250.t1
MASALYDSYTFYKGLRASKEALSSQAYDFFTILIFAMFTASINAMALLLDYFRVRLPELGDRNFRLSTLCKCFLLFLKLRVLKVPLTVYVQMDSTWLSEISTYPRVLGERIPIWMCADPGLCPLKCRHDLGGTCSYTNQPAYGGCFCEYFSTGIPVLSDRFMVFGNCFISACAIALLTNSRMRTRGVFRYPELSLFALGCSTFLPTAFIALNTIYLSVPSLAARHLRFPNDFLVLTIPALIFILMANEMARRLETAWKLRHLAPYERVTLSWCESAWQVVNCHGLDHLNGARVEAVDDQNRSLLERPDAPQGARGARGSEITVQGPAVLLSKDPPRYGSLWVSSGFRSLTPLAHWTTVIAILKVWDRLHMPVILCDVLLLLVLSVAASILNFTLLDEEMDETLGNSDPPLLEIPKLKGACGEVDQLVCGLVSAIDSLREHVDQLRGSDLRREVYAMDRQAQDWVDKVEKEAVESLTGYRDGVDTMMEVHVVGLSHHSAPVEVREKLAVAQADWNAYAQAMCSVGNGTGETISSSYTCMWVCSQVGRSPKDPP